MKIPNIAGEFLYRALVRKHGDYINSEGFKLTEEYYSSREDVYQDMPIGSDIKWPVEIVEGNIAYVAAPEEYQ